MEFPRQVGFCALILFVCGCPGDDSDSSQPNHVTNAPDELQTQWQIQPSLKYDALCFVNTLTGDPFYLQYYSQEFAYFEPKLDSVTTAALANLKRQLKDEQGLILSASLALLFSATDGETLSDLITTVEDSGDLQEGFMTSPYYSDGAWTIYEMVRPDLLTIFQFLHAAGFSEYWTDQVEPRVLRRIDELGPDIRQFDVVAEVERGLGQPLASDTITVFMLYFSQPHGIKITGTRFLTDIAWDASNLLHTAVHEMMHPPYSYSSDEELRAALETLQQDPFLMDKVEHHDPAYGYNSFEGYVEENVVRALSHLLTERLRGDIDHSHYGMKQADGGMHVLMAALYSLMLDEDYNSKGELVRDFLIRVIEAGALDPGQIEARYNALE
ncbi:MAG: hypothetical protein HN712_04400 [Gemmatimonadetes bacterium]|jgi:hypothetical protein|nr:hypothetical protein [Gemmatimonadota bacterium]MBT6149280.1 hypothetical protein [Gemmatimonadota bacterium]MBT7859525.1 hypothetical protein [Gemmatimonadota bacterium]